MTGGEVIRARIEMLHHSGGGIDDGQLRVGPVNYARQLARYIRDASTIRARTMNEWGRAPTVEAIRGYLADAEADRAAYAAESHRIVPKDEDATNYALSPAIGALQSHYRALRQNKPLPQPEPMPVPVAKMPKRSFFIGEIFAQIARAMSVEPHEIAGASRHRKYAQVRQVISFVLHKRGTSYSRIGALMNRDHTTVLSNVRRFETHATDRMREIADHFIASQPVPEVEAEAA